MKLSIVINADTRAGFTQNHTAATKMFSGCVSEDFLTDGVFNKVRFFKGFDIEVILFVDEHEPLPDGTLDYVRKMCDVVVIRKHTSEHGFNDYNYLSALQLARGEYIIHFDQDTAAFTSSPEPIHNLLALLDTHRFVSYPSHWSPKPVHDESFGNRTWASTRFFMCKRETLKFDILRQCIEEPNWAYSIYGDSPRRCNWMEHFLTLTNNDSCFYPPIDIDKYSIFSWGSYERDTLRKLNNQSYEEVKAFVNSKGIVYPNDIFL